MAAKEGVATCVEGSEYILMPLTRGEIIGYDAQRMSYRFFMKDGSKSVHCEISGTALQDLAGTRWATSQLPNRDEQFLAFRDLIEQMAADQFQRNGAGPVRIFAKHIPRVNRHVSPPVGGAKS